MINTLMNWINKAIAGENYILIVLIIFLSIIIKFKTIYKALDEIQKNKLNFLFEMQKKDFLDDTTKESINESINNKIFKISTGINTNKFFRNKIMELYKQYNGEISLRQLKLSFKFFSISNDKISIQFDKGDIALYIFNIFSGVVLLLLGLIYIIAPIQIKTIPTSDIILLFIVGLIFISISILPLKEVLEYRIAKKVKKIIDK